MKYDYLVVGSGLFGAVFTNEALKKGKKCLVIEKRNHIGGNAYTEEIEGICVHKYGPHIFHTDDRRIWDYVNQFSPFNDFINTPVANYNGEIFNLPFNMNTFAKIFGISSPIEAKAIIDNEKSEISGEPQNLEEQAISLVGRTVYEKLIKGYTEKQWGKSCKALPAFIIRRIPVRFTYNNNYFNDKYQGIPTEGYTEIISRMLKGCELRLGVNFLDNKKELNRLAEKIIYTGAIDEYFGFSLGELEYRSLEFENEILDVNDYQGVAVVNYTDSKTPYTRIIEHKHFNFSSSEKTVITREYPVNRTADREPYYPVNDQRNTRLCNSYMKLAEREKNVIFGGRLGMYKYFDMDKVIKSALDLAERELG